MPSDAVILAEKTAAMGKKTAADAALGLVVPRLQFIEMPVRLTRAYPELAKWHQLNHEALEQWREKTNIVLNRVTTEQAVKTKKETEDAIQAAIDALP
jgi:uracil DNA glycosylase